MHPNPAFRQPDESLSEALVNDIGFGMVFLQTPDGPRVAHTPLMKFGNLVSEDCRIQFHLARGNALSRHLDGARAMLVINGPDAYISARWYEDSDQVPTWNYAAIELEGKISKMDSDGLPLLLSQLTSRHEAEIKGGTPWTMDKLSPKKRDGLLKAIIGFEMQVENFRETFKLSQNKSAEEKERLVKGLEAQGDHRMANMMQRPIR
jgi:transcriptional regulator